MKHSPANGYFANIGAPQDSAITRPCCGASTSVFDRATGSVYLPHKVSAADCAWWFAQRAAERSNAA